MSRVYATCPAQSEIGRAWYCWVSSAFTRSLIQNIARPRAGFTLPALIMDIKQFINMDPSKAASWPPGECSAAILSIPGVMTLFRRRILFP